ncbi:MAG: hypothetical protein AAF787_16505 [Chloroflexota bacterium]
MLYYLPALILVVIAVVLTIILWTRRPALTRQPLLIVFIGIPAIFVVLGLVMSTVFVYLQRAQTIELALMPTGTDLSVFSQPENGTRLALTGTLVDNPVLTDEEFDIADMGFVIFLLEQFNDEDETIVWMLIRQQNQPLTLMVDGGEVELLTGEGGNTRLSNAGRERLGDSNFRVGGFRNGDSVTVIGSKSSDSQLTASRIHGGDIASMIENDAGNAIALGIIGLCFGMFGGGFILVVLLIAGRRKPPPEAPSPA